MLHAKLPHCVTRKISTVFYTYFISKSTTKCYTQICYPVLHVKVPTCVTRKIATLCYT